MNVELMLVSKPETATGVTVASAIGCVLEMGQYLTQEIFVVPGFVEEGT